MNKFYALLLLTGIGSLQTKAQQFTAPNLSYNKFYPGTVSTLDGQVLQGYIINRGPEQNQKKCVFYTDFNDDRTRKEYSPTHISGYSVENNQYKSIPYAGNIAFGKPDKHFVFVAKPGAITTYVFWAPEEQMVWQKGDEAPVSNASLFMGFKKNMLKLVNDHAELAGKVERKEKGYGVTSVMQIIEEYNDWAASKK